MQICMSACLHVCLSTCLCVYLFSSLLLSMLLCGLSFCFLYCPAYLLVFFVVYLSQVCLSIFVLSKCRMSACLYMGCLCLFVYLSMYVVSTCYMSVCLMSTWPLLISVLGWVDWMSQKSFSWSYSKHILVYVNIL